MSESSTGEFPISRGSFSHKQNNTAKIVTFFRFLSQSFKRFVRYNHLLKSRISRYILLIASYIETQKDELVALNIIFIIQVRAGNCEHKFRLAQNVGMYSVKFELLFLCLHLVRNSNQRQFNGNFFNRTKIKAWIEDEGQPSKLWMASHYLHSTYCAIAVA